MYPSAPFFIRATPGLSTRPCRATALKGPAFGFLNSCSCERAGVCGFIVQFTTRTNSRTMKRSRKPFASTVNRVCEVKFCEAWGAYRNAVRAPCAALPLCDPKRPTGAYLALAFLKS